MASDFAQSYKKFLYTPNYRAAKRTLPQQILIHIISSNSAEASNIGSLRKMIYVSALITV
jgi:hypothetical protein